jgi:hypothetical protein
VALPNPLLNGGSLTDGRIGPDSSAALWVRPARVSIMTMPSPPAPLLELPPWWNDRLFDSILHVSHWRAHNCSLRPAARRPETPVRRPWRPALPRPRRRARDRDSARVAAVWPVAILAEEPASQFDAARGGWAPARQAYADGAALPTSAAQELTAPEAALHHTRMLTTIAHNL